MRLIKGLLSRISRLLRRTLLWRIVFAIFLVAFVHLLQISFRPKNVYPAQVTRVIDGDTFEVKIASKVLNVRITGVDCPEDTKIVELLGPEATKYTQDLILGKTVWLEIDKAPKDPYDRLLAYVWLQNPASLNKLKTPSLISRYQLQGCLLKHGLGEAKYFPPNSKYRVYYKLIELKSKIQGQGLWDDSLNYSARQATRHIQYKSCFTP